jgi:hypothetical protein
LEPDPVEAAKWHFIAAKAGRTDGWLDRYVAALDATRKAEAEARAAAFKPQLPKVPNSG